MQLYYAQKRGVDLVPVQILPIIMMIFANVWFMKHPRFGL